MLTPKVKEITRGSAHAEKAGQVTSGARRLRCLPASPHTDSLATLAFLRAIARTASSRAAQTPPAAVEQVA